MNCERIETLLIAYLDGRVGDAERREVETHLDACAACRARAEEFRRVWGVLDEVPEVEPTLGFDARVRQRLVAEPKPRLLEWLIPSPRLAFAVSLLLVLSVWVSSFPPVAVPDQAANARAEEEFEMIQNLQVLEDYEVLANLDALSAVPAPRPATKPNREM